MRKDLNEALQVLLAAPPEVYASVHGSIRYPDIHGGIYFYPLWQGTLVAADIAGLPYEDGNCPKSVFGFHIHEGSKCSGNMTDPFADTGGHFNPNSCKHPQHAGDFPPLFGNHGYALSIFYTERFMPEEIIGRTAVIHGMSDDLHTQPSGNSGIKIACGEILENRE